MSTSASFPGDGTASITLDNGTEAVYDPALSAELPWLIRVHHVFDPDEDIDSIHAMAVEQGWV